MSAPRPPAALSGAWVGPLGTGRGVMAAMCSAGLGGEGRDGSAEAERFPHRETSGRAECGISG